VRTEPLVSKSVAVTLLTDKRENVNHNLIDVGYIPLMPLGWMNLNTPEWGRAHVVSGPWLFRPLEDIARAIAEEVNDSRIFKETFFANSANDGELNLRGNLKSTYFHGTVLTYCTSIFAPYLWFVGFPTGNYGNNLEISFELVESSTGEVLWNGTYKKEFSKVFWIYAPGVDFRYDRLLKDIMKDAIQSLENEFAK
jgi:hypothetical protein